MKLSYPIVILRNVDSARSREILRFAQDDKLTKMP